MIEIAKRIEGGLQAMMLAISASPTTIAEILNYADRIAAAKAAADKAAAAQAAAAAAAKAAADREAANKAAAAKAEADRAAAAARAAAQPKKGVVTVRSLHIRKDHSTTAETVAGLVKDDEVTFTETWTDGKNTWVKLGPDKWAAMIYNGETYIKVS